MHNFSDDLALSAWGETVSKLIDTLELASNTSIGWFAKNEIIINPDKFQVIVLHKKKSNRANIPLTTDNQSIKSVPSVELLRILLDVKYNLYISNICRSDANQLNTLIRSKSHLRFNVKGILLKSDIISDVEYCPGLDIF